VPRLDWSRPLPRPLVIPKVMKLAQCDRLSDDRNINSQTGRLVALTSF
jgi:hypothetical protein